MMQLRPFACIAMVSFVASDGGKGLTSVISTSPNTPEGYQAIPLFDGEWVPGVHMPLDISDHQAITCGANIYLIGGLDNHGNVSDAVWLFNPVLETYSLQASMPTPRYRFGAACLHDVHIYVGGGASNAIDGDNGHFLQSVDVFDVRSNTWAAGPSLPSARGDLAFAAVDGHVYAMGGYGYGYPYPDPALTANEQLNLAGTAWTSRAGLPDGGKGDISAAVIDGLVYIPGGWNDNFLDTLVVYNPSTDRWASRASMSRARGDKAMVTVDGHLYVFGGEIWSGKKAPCSWDPSQECKVNKMPIRSCEMYRPEYDKWFNFSPLPTALFRFSAATAGEGEESAIFLFGGQGHGQIAVNEVNLFHHLHRPDVFLYVPLNGAVSLHTDDHTDDDDTRKLAIAGIVVGVGGLLVGFVAVLCLISMKSRVAIPVTRTLSDSYKNDATVSQTKTADCADANL